MQQKKIIVKVALLLSAFLIYIAIGYWLNASPNGWYESLKKPSFTPPNWIFDPVWTILYLLMIVSIILVWNAPSSENSKIKTFKKQAEFFFWGQLLFNFLWPTLFFHFHWIGLAFIDIVFLQIYCIMAMFAFYQMHQVLAACLFIPYVLWVSFALLLNLSIFLINT